MQPNDFSGELSRPHYWRRDGTPYPSGYAGLIEWAKDFERRDIKRVVESRTPWGDRVSTVWLGLDHSFGDGPPLIFETMVFDRKGDEIFCDRYSTELEALDGHRRAYWRALIPPPFVRFLQKHFGRND